MFTYLFTSSIGNQTSFILSVVLKKTTHRKSVLQYLNLDLISIQHCIEMYIALTQTRNLIAIFIL